MLARLAIPAVLLWALHQPLLAMLPAHAAHELDGTCRWRAKPWAARLDATPAPINTLAGRREVWACQKARGAITRSWDLREIRRTWPSRAELAALHAQEPDLANPLSSITIPAADLSPDLIR